MCIGVVSLGGAVKKKTYAVFWDATLKLSNCHGGFPGKKSWCLCLNWAQSIVEDLLLKIR